ncbi:MAG: electron transporter RnfB [Acidimicrobiaceae bacterium]|nr:electron transporter RnfB [Acidimicrobiaceae bacterium]
MTAHTLLGPLLEISDLCTACGACLPTCHRHALRKSVRKPRIVFQLCNLCFDCIEICPRNAISEVKW